MWVTVHIVHTYQRWYRRREKKKWSGCSAWVSISISFSSFSAASNLPSSLPLVNESNSWRSCSIRGPGISFIIESRFHLPVSKYEINYEVTHNYTSGGQSIYCLPDVTHIIENSLAPLQTDIDTGIYIEKEAQLTIQLLVCGHFNSILVTNQINCSNAKSLL